MRIRMLLGVVVVALVVISVAPAGATVVDKTGANTRYATASFDDGVSSLALFSIGVTEISPGSDWGWAGELPSKVWANWKGDPSCSFNDAFLDYDLQWSMNHVTVGIDTPCGYFETEWHAIAGPDVDHEWDHYNGFWSDTHSVRNGKNSPAVATLTIDGVLTSLRTPEFGALIWRQTWSGTTK